MVNSKFLRNYERTRGYLNQLDELGHEPALNGIYHAFPPDFEKPGMLQRIRQAFAPYKRKVDMFDINLARLYRRNQRKKVAICCMPKSGSTFILRSLARLETERFTGVFLQTPYLNPDFVGAFACEHEIDELSLLLLEMRDTNWTSHMHTKWTPYTERTFLAHDIKPIVTYRNIFDCIVSMDDMLMKRETAGFPMLRLPKAYHAMADDERLTLLCHFAGPWYVDFVVSWSRATMPVLRLDYDADIRGFSAETAEKLRSYLGLEAVPSAEFMAAFDVSDSEAKSLARINKGISGRGARIPEPAREHVRFLTRAFEDEVDFSGLI